MKDMFYNYEYHIGQKEYSHGPAPMHPDKLDNNPNVEVVKDAFGNEIGIRAHKDSKFSLYFFLADCHNCSYDDKLMDMLNSGAILFEVISLHHDTVYSKTIAAKEIIDDTVCVELNSNSSNMLTTGLYRLKLSIINDSVETKQAIFFEEDSFLDII